MEVTDWTARAACAQRNPDELFVRGSAQNRAKLICAPCRVRDECLAEVLDHQLGFGVWGRLTNANDTRCCAATTK